MELLILLGLVAMGLGAGVLGALFGLGGGIVFVPVLTLVFGLAPADAVAVSLVGIIAGSVGASTVFVEKGLSNVRLGLLLEITTAAGAVIGAVAATFLEQWILMVLFSIVVYISAWRMIRNPEKVVPPAEGAEGRFAFRYEDEKTGECFDTGTGHGAAVIAHHLANGGGRLDAGHVHHRGAELGMALAVLQDPVGSVEKMNVAGSTEVLPESGPDIRNWFAREYGLDEFGDRQSPVLIGDSGIRGPVIDRYAERRLGAIIWYIGRRHGAKQRIAVRIVPEHIRKERKAELFGERAGNSGADKPSGVLPHHAEDIGRYELRSDRQIRLALPIIEIIDENRLSSPDRFEHFIEPQDQNL